MTNKTQEPDGKICIAQIGAAHGIRGEVRIKLFSDDPASLTKYGPLETADGSRTFKIESARFAKTVYVCRVKGLRSRNDAEALNGVRLYAKRDLLPDLDEEEFYHSDLVGLEVRLEDGSVVGSVVAVHDFGAGDLLDVVPSRGKGHYIPFTREIVPLVKPSDGYLTIYPPEGLLDDAADGERAKEGKGADFSAQPELLDGLEKDG